jgi:carbonic anhydrase/acetyltransferase-like protein (isoleucine patch superfamily)
MAMDGDLSGAPNGDHPAVNGVSTAAVGGAPRPTEIGSALGRLWAARAGWLCSGRRSTRDAIDAARLGARFTLRSHPKVVNQGVMTIGDRVRLDATVAALELVTLPGGHLEIGDNVFINYGGSLASSAHVRVSNDRLIGTHVMVMDRDFHRTGAPVLLEERAWVGNRSIVQKGMTIGHNAVVSAGRVVTRDVPPRTAYAGVPACAVWRF